MSAVRLSQRRLPAADYPGHRTKAGYERHPAVTDRCLQASCQASYRVSPADALLKRAGAGTLGGAGRLPNLVVTSGSRAASNPRRWATIR